MKCVYLTWSRSKSFITCVSYTYPCYFTPTQSSLNLHRLVHDGITFRWYIRSVPWDTVRLMSLPVAYTRTGERPRSPDIGSSSNLCVFTAQCHRMIPSLPRTLLPFTHSRLRSLFLQPFMVIIRSSGRLASSHIWNRRELFFSFSKSNNGSIVLIFFAIAFSRSFGWLKFILSDSQFFKSCVKSSNLEI